MATITTPVTWCRTQTLQRTDRTPLMFRDPGGVTRQAGARTRQVAESSVSSGKECSALLNSPFAAPTAFAQPCGLNFSCTLSCFAIRAQSNDCKWHGEPRLSCTVWAASRWMSSLSASPATTWNGPKLRQTLTGSGDVAVKSLVSRLAALGEKPVPRAVCVHRLYLPSALVRGGWVTPESCKATRMATPVRLHFLACFTPRRLCQHKRVLLGVQHQVLERIGDEHRESLISGIVVSGSSDNAASTRMPPDDARGAA